MNVFMKSAFVSLIMQSKGLDALQWFEERRYAHKFQIKQIPFSKLDKWHFNLITGNLCHESGKFFSIEGIRVKTNWGEVPEWEQPIINQPEVGFLGFITKEFDGLLYFLVQAKMEPGNINMIQLAPTLQATRSNFTRVHQGQTPPYLEYFTNLGHSKVLVDSFQSEQGAFFLRKRNRNIIIQVSDDVPVYDDYCWMTLGQILELVWHNNLVNMDARTVLACIPHEFNGRDHSKVDDEYIQALLRSFDPSTLLFNSNEEIISWFTELKFKYELDVERIPLSAVSQWVKTDTAIHHETMNYFSVIACAVESDSREVVKWTQPLIKAHQIGIIAFIVKIVNDVLYFLVQGKVEPGNFDIVEMAPTVQCLTGSYDNVPIEKLPPFTDYVLNAKPGRIRYDKFQSEEGGRFYRMENRNIIIEADDDFPQSHPENYIWMTGYQLKEFIKYNNYLNVQARCLLSTIRFG